jgi:hypothetical protein
VQTYRLHQTATYRREKLGVTQQLAEFNAQLLQVVRRQVEATQAAFADVAWGTGPNRRASMITFRTENTRRSTEG